MLNGLVVFFGSGLGGVLRWAVGGWIGQRTSPGFPWGTLVVNITGSLAIGLFAALSAHEGRWLGSTTWRQLLMVGVCGGYTTFSSFSLQTLNLVHEGQWVRAGANIALSIGLCLLAVWLGHLLGTWMQGAKGS